jgi:hypothetical protein
MQLQRSSIVLLTAFALACADGSRPVIKVGTSGTSFQRESVPSTATSPIALVPTMTWNRGNATAFIPTCGTQPLPTVERFVNGSWESYAGGFCAAVMVIAPAELRAGESRNDHVAIGDAGRYRLHVTYWGDAGARDRYETVSDEFTVQ